MSTVATIWAGNLRDFERPADKLVLWAMADAAREEFLCFSSVASIVDFTGLDRKTVMASQARLRGTNGAGLIVDTGERRGSTKQIIVWRLAVNGSAAVVDYNDAENGTVPKTEQYQKRNSPENGGEEYQKRDTEPVLEPVTPAKAKALATPDRGSPTGKSNKAGKKPRKEAVRSSRLAADWQPPSIADLPLTVQAMIRNWPAGAYEVTAEGFRNHWQAEGRAIGAKRDWPKTWHNWLMRECTAVARAVRAGVTFTPAAQAGSTMSEADMAAAFDATADRFERMGRTDDAAEQRRQAQAVRARLAGGPRSDYVPVRSAAG